MKYTCYILLLLLLAVPACAVDRDIHSSLAPTLGIAPVVITGNTAVSTGIIDTSLYAGLEFYFLTGTLADSNATFAVSVAGGDVVDTTGTTITDSAAITKASEFIGSTTTASFRYDDDNDVHRLGYVGSKRYIIVTVTPSGNSGNAPFACLVVGRPYLKPTD